MSPSSGEVSEGVHDVAVERVLEQLPEELAREPRYRHTVTYLVSAGGSGTTSALTRRLATAEADPADADTEHYREVYRWLHGTAIPTLRQFGLVDYDGERGELTLSAAAQSA